MRQAKTPAVWAVNEAVGRRLAAMREQLGLSRADVARAVGCDYRRIFRIEIGETSIRFHDVPVFAGIFEVDPGELARELALLAVTR